MRIDISSTPVRITGFVLGLAAVLAIALGVGKAVGPSDHPATAESTDGHGHGEPAPGATTTSAAGHGGHGSSETTAPTGPAEVPAGLQVSEHGYTLHLATASAAPGTGVPVSFHVTGPDGKPVTAYDVEHEKRLHFIAVRRDFTGFQHVHPTLGADGTWSTALDLTSGTWRVFADFKATGAQALTLGADLNVTGDYAPAPAAPETRTSTVDGYTVTVAGDLKAGGDSQLTLNVSKDGKPVTDLQPYLGAYGHLVALREGDLAYLHVHPDGEPGDGRTESGPDVVFHTDVPSAGGYRLYLDFQHGGVVRTASFALNAR